MIMAHSALTPVFTGLRAGLHGLVVALTALVAGRALFASEATGAGGYAPPAGIVVAACVVFLAVYAAGSVLARRTTNHPPAPAAGLSRPSDGQAEPAVAPAGVMWFAALTVLWVALLWLSPDAAYLAFPLFFLALHLLPRTPSLFVVGAVAVLAVVGIARHAGWSVGGIVGPLVGAGVAVLIGLGYRSLVDEARERDRLVAELLATRDELAASQHESGVLAERARLARDIHDTVAQGLSSIQLLLHATERSAPDHPAIEQVRLARETAAANLADTRRFIRELAPPALDDEQLPGALRRLAATQWNVGGLHVEVQADDAGGLPMYMQTALLRIAQGAVANVVQHASAERVDLAVSTGKGGVRLTVTDDGCGFDVEEGRRAARRSPDSFGLVATAERVEQLGGRLDVGSRPGAGTTLTVDLPWEHT